MYNVTVPPNSTATLFLNSGKILESGKEIEKAEGIKRISKSGLNTVLELEPGKYSFLINKETV